MDTGSGLVSGASTTERSIVNVRYDAGTQSYTIEADGRAQTFMPLDMQTGSNPGETRYYKTDGTNKDYLTLVVTPPSSGPTIETANEYVGLGYWQRDKLNGSIQDSNFETFVYGFETPGSAVPRNGTAAYRTNAFGFVTTPGKQPRSFKGYGTFHVDLMRGIFGAHTWVTEQTLTDPLMWIAGGGIEFFAGGYLTSGNGFSGNFAYSGQDGQLSGTIGGRFYGPDAEELGASFTGDNGTGASVTGSLTGQRKTDIPPENLTLDYVANDLEYAKVYTLIGSDSDGPDAMPLASLSADTVIVEMRPDGRFLLAPTTTADAEFTSADLIADSRPNFISYRKTVSGKPATVSLYRPGNDNTELALTYTGFGSWRGGSSEGSDAYNSRYYFTYGIETANGLLSRRTGTGRYDGVAYGTGVLTGGQIYAIDGTSRFDVDFGTQSFAGSLQLSGTPESGGPTVNIGTWTFADAMANGQLVETQLFQPGMAHDGFSMINPRFYGPDGEEISGKFMLFTGAPYASGTIAVTGATVAKRQ